MNPLSLLFILGYPLFSYALDLPFSARRPHPTLTRRDLSKRDDGSLSLSTVRDMIYMSNITAGGQDYVVQMDTGSSDVWLKAPSSPPLVNSKQTSLTANLTFGIGWAYGVVSYIPIVFAGESVPSQAYVDVTSANNPALTTYDADGLVGFGFNTLSTVDSLLNATGASNGRNLLYNIFQGNKSEKNFIAFSFQRSTDSTDDVQGKFTIGEYEQNYSSIASTPIVPTWPTDSPTRWNVLVEAFLIGSQTVLPSSTVPDAPGNKGVTLLDTGTSYSYVPREVSDAIYGSIDGASYNSETGYYDVPCNAEIDMAIQIGGRVFPLDPIDVSPYSYDGTSTTCIGSFLPGTITAAEGQFDYLFGVNVLRNVYSLYDFGDFDSSGDMGSPYVQLLSLTDPNEASKSFCQERSCTARTGISYKASGNTYNSPANFVSVSASDAQAMDRFSIYFPAMLAIMGLNAIVLLVLAVVGTILLCRKCKTKRRARTPAARLNVGAGQPHTYEPVSMALTEDTMVPPSPAFRKSQGGSFKLGDRPKSLATLPSRSKYDDDSDDAMLSPASPGFRQVDSRPRSMAVLPSQYSKVPEDEPFTPPKMIDEEVFPSKSFEEAPESPYKPPSTQSPPSPTPSHESSKKSVSSEEVPRQRAVSFEEAPPLPARRQRTMTEATLVAPGPADVPETTPLPPSPSIRSFTDSPRPSSQYSEPVVPRPIPRPPNARFAGARPMSNYTDGRPMSNYVDAPGRPMSSYVDAPGRPMSGYVEGPVRNFARPTSHYVDASERPTSYYVDAPESFGDSGEQSPPPTMQFSPPPPPGAAPPRRSPLNNVYDPSSEDQDLVPPNPSFRGRGGSGDRPRSALVMPSQQSNNPYVNAAPQQGSTTLRPPGTLSNLNERPRSFA